MRDLLVMAEPEAPVKEPPTKTEPDKAPAKPFTEPKRCPSPKPSHTPDEDYPTCRVSSQNEVAPQNSFELASGLAVPDDWDY